MKIICILTLIFLSSPVFGQDVLMKCGWEGEYPDKEFYTFNINVKDKSVENVSSTVCCHKLSVVVFDDNWIQFISGVEQGEKEFTKKSNSSDYCKTSEGLNDIEFCFTMYKEVKNVFFYRHFKINRFTGEFSYFDRNGYESDSDFFEGRVNGTCEKVKKLL
jgi:hypothetical protein